MPITITIYITCNDYYCIAQNIFVTDVHRCIDGDTGAGNICKLWKNHFHQLLNCIHDDDALHVDVIYSKLVK